jgi:hypothetical protein
MWVHSFVVNRRCHLASSSIDARVTARWNWSWPFSWSSEGCSTPREGQPPSVLKSLGCPKSLDLFAGPRVGRDEATPTLAARMYPISWRRDGEGVVVGGRVVRNFLLAKAARECSLPAVVVAAAIENYCVGVFAFEATSPRRLPWTSFSCCYDSSWFVFFHSRCNQ